MPVHLCRARVPQDFHGLFSALRFRFDKNKLAIVIKVHGVSADHVGRQVIIGKMGFEGLDDRVLGMLSRLSSPFRFGVAAPCRRRTIPRRKDRGSATTRLSPHDSLIINCVFKPRASQSLDGFFQVESVVEYPHDSCHMSGRDG
jgi:hypothetical protein